MRIHTRRWFVGTMVLSGVVLALPGLRAQAPAPAGRGQAPGQATAAPAEPAVPPPPAASYSLVKEAYADIPGARLFYIDSGGRGTPVVFLHAGTGSARIWEHQIAPFTSAGFRVIAYDRRGYGRTTVDAAGPASTAADDLNALITFLGIDRFHLVGTAAGGGVSFDYALSFPQRLRSLTIANSLGNVSDPDYTAMTGRLLPPQWNSLPADFKELGPSYRAANPEGAKRWADFEKVSRAVGPRPAGQGSKNRVTFAALETIKTPTLLITGDADLYTPPAALKLFIARMKGAESLIVPEVGHSTHWEQPEIFNKTVIEFLKKH